jgi:ribosomal protein S18 acetylase RimI-like enzyme
VSVAILDQESEHATLNAFLDARIYEFNTQASGAHDGRVLAGAVRNAAGEIVAGVTGHSWGGTCQVTYLWIHQEHRHQGLGTQLMKSVEEEALRRGCAQILVGTHSFQAPRFYERLGFRRVAEIQNYPKGHAQLYYVKPLAPASPDVQP